MSRCQSSSEGQLPLQPCGGSPEGNEEGERDGEQRERAQRKNKNLLGLVSNLQQLSTHQRKTAYGKGTVRGCLLKRITALKGSEAKQQYEFRCSCRVMRRVDLREIIPRRVLKHWKIHSAPIYLLIHPSTHLPICLSIAFYFLCWGKNAGEHISGVTACHVESIHYSTRWIQTDIDVKCASQHTRHCFCL